VSRRFSELGSPDGLVKSDGPLDRLMDGLDSSWYQLDRMVFGSFVGVMSNAGQIRPEVWIGLRDCWDNMRKMDDEFCRMLETGECGGPKALLDPCGEFVADVDTFGPELNQLGMAIATAYLARVPTCWIEHLDILARARLLAVDLTGGPSFEYADRLLSLHRCKLGVLRLKLEKTVFRLNSKLMQNQYPRTVAAVAIFRNMIGTGTDIRTALAHVVGRYNLPVEML